MKWRSILASILPQADSMDTMPKGGESRSSYERLAVPHTFQPVLSVSDATWFALRALLRIFLGSLLFGAWGAYTMLAWANIHNPYLRAAAMVPIFALFLGLLAGLMIATSWLLRPRRTGV